MSSVRGAVRSGWPDGSGSTSKTSSPAPPMDPARQGVEERVLVDDRAARRVDEERIRAHEAQLARADEPARAVGELLVDRDHVRAGQEIVELDPLHADLGGVGRLQVRAPGDDVHPEGETDRGDAPPQAAEPDDPEPLALEVAAGRLLPPARADRCVLLAQVLHEAQDERPRELGGRAAAAARPADHDAVVAGRVEVDRRVHHPRRHEQPQRRQPVEHGARERGALPHRDDDLVRREPRRRVVEVLGDEVHVRAPVQTLPRAQAARDRPVVVQDRHAGHAISPPRSPGAGGTPCATAATRSR